MKRKDFPYNNEQLTYLADCLKVIVTGQLALIGYNALRDGNIWPFAVTLPITFVGIVDGLWLLGKIKEE